MHRLVQAVIKDGLDDDEEQKYMEMTIALFLSAFPRFQEDTRQICRRYQAQIVEPLFDITKIETEGVANMLLRAGYFLREDGKYHDAERFERKACEICVTLFGQDDSYLNWNKQSCRDV